MTDEESFWGMERAGHAGGGRSASSLDVEVLLLGLLTFWPPVYFVLFVLVVLSGFAGAPLLAVHLLTMLEMLGLTVFYGWHVYMDATLVGDRKVLWMVIVLLGGFIGQAIYYVLWIVKRDPVVLGARATPSPSESTACPCCTSCGAPFDPADNDGGFGTPRCAECHEPLAMPHTEQARPADFGLR